VAIENIIAFVIATLAFCVVGFSFMFGQTQGGLIGGSNWLLQNLKGDYDYIFRAVRAHVCRNSSYDFLRQHVRTHQAQSAGDCRNRHRRIYLSGLRTLGLGRKLHAAENISRQPRIYGFCWRNRGALIPQAG
jgi:hypothetical protein